MQIIGALKTIDQMGRITIPASIREALDVGPSDKVEIYVQNEYIVLRKYNPNKDSCIFCANELNGAVFQFKGRPVCRDCRTKLASYYGN